MAKDFNPDDFLEKTAPIVDFQQEEKRKQEQTQQQMAAQPQPGMLEQAGNLANEIAPAALGYAIEHPAQAAYAASYVPGVNKLPGISTIKAGREAAGNLFNRFAGPVAPQAPTPGTAGYPIGGAPTNVPPAQQPSVIQRGMNYANQMRQAAASRVLPMAGAAVPAAVTGAVAAPGAAMMYDAYRNFQQQTPEQRKQSAMEALSGQGMGQAGIY